MTLTVSWRGVGPQYFPVRTAIRCGSITNLAFRSDVHLSDEEKRMPSQLSEIADPLEHPFWGRLQFVQCGELSAGHVHPPLEG